MTVKDVIKEAARLVGDEELFKALDKSDESATTVSTTTESGIAVTSDEETEAKTQIMLKCFNDIYFEAATEIYPLEAEEEVGKGKIKFEDLSVYPQKIKRIRKDGVNVGFYVGSGYFETDCGGTVTYEKFPTEKSLNDDFEYEKTAVNKTVFCYGIAAEYCLITGRFSESVNWESRYNNAVAGVTAKRGRAGRIGNPRMWR